MPTATFNSLGRQRRFKPPGGSEDDFERWVLSAARFFGWHGYHVRRSKGAVRGVHYLNNSDHQDALGFPDWFFWRDVPGHQGALFRELKTDDGTVLRTQRDCIQRLRDAGLDADVWRPRDSPRILAELT
jgi:hypothetical protein